MKLNFYTFFLIQLVGFQLCAQEIVMEGAVVNAENQLPIEFVNIGILNKNQGTITTAQGKFSFTVSKEFKKDSITISHINYHPLRILVKSFLNRTIALAPKTTELAEVIVLNKKKRTRKIGVKSYSRFLSMQVVSQNNDIVEAAQRINIPNKEVKIKAVNFAIRKWSKIDEVKVRINFYKNIGNAPQEKIVFKNIVVEIPPQGKSDWIHINLNEEEVYIKENFFIGIEFIPNFENPTIVNLGAILTKGKGYSRQSSLGSWAKLNGGASINVEVAY